MGHHHRPAPPRERLKQLTVLENRLVEQRQIAVRVDAAAPQARVVLEAAGHAEHREPFQEDTGRGTDLVGRAPETATLHGQEALGPRHIQHGG